MVGWSSDVCLFLETKQIIMLKGISERNHVWHLRNHIRNAKKKVSHARRMALYRNDEGAYVRSQKAKSKRDAYAAADKAKERMKALSWWERFKLFISRLFSKYART